ncbi:unnamed protein product [Dibothriocephalus latus]|uniref:Uncharacterized protein n=1 Tax=Dibothriocephalus latus TaxID=60516 RepID=A0A3P7LM19_DIBLA|nr:unnamed protein product [Dibothriocephalus latus]
MWIAPVVRFSKLEEERRLKAERGSSLLAKMASMQRKLFAASAQLGDVVEASEKTTVQSLQVSKVEEERRLKAERGSSLIAKMARMQRKLFAASAQLEDVMQAKEKTTVQSPQAKAEEAKPEDFSHDSNNLSRLAVLGPFALVDRLKVLEKKPSALKCVICLEEVSVDSQHALVVPAYAAPSTVLFTPPPCPHAVFSESEGTSSPRYCASADWTWIDRHLTAIATSAVAALVGNEWALPSPLPRLLAYLPSCVIGTSGKNKIKPQPAATLSTEPGTAPPRSHLLSAV